MKNRSGEKIKLASIDELLGVVNEESAMEIEISKIHPFKNHPFKVLDDEKMQDLVESVKINGVLTPVLLRMDENEEYEMVSGHRRMHAAQLAGLTTIPAIVRELSDDDAIVAMVDANIQREELLPSEKAFAYKMKLAAMKRQAGRPKSNSGQNDQNLIGTVSRDVLAEQVGESSKQIQRYIRLTELIPELLDLVDNKKLAGLFHPVHEVPQMEQTVLPCVLHPWDVSWKPVLVNINTVDMHLPALFTPPLSTVTTYLLIAFSISRTLQQVGSPHDRILSITLLYIQYCFL